MSEVGPGSERVPALSVVLPVWKPSPTFLRLAVRSILEQTYSDFELLIVEDPSESHAADVLAAFDDRRIRLVTHPQRSSMVEQLNRGVEMARAPWIARMDGDDIALPTRFQRQMEALVADSRVDVLGTQIEVIDSQGNTIGKREFPTVHAEIVAAMHRYNPVSHPSVIMRRSAVMEAGAYRYPGRAAQDYDLWSRMANSGAVFSNLPGAYLQYRLHGGSVKSLQVKPTLRATVAVKREHWKRTMGWMDRLFYVAEKGALVVPSFLVQRLAQHRRYRV